MLQDYYLSISFAQTISNPACLNPKSIPPIPENKLATLTFILHIPFLLYSNYIINYEELQKPNTINTITAWLLEYQNNLISANPSLQILLKEQI